MERPIGSLDPEQVFYLQSRGMPRDEAEALLLEAFGSEAIERVEDETFAEVLLAPFRAWLAARGAKPRGGARMNDAVHTATAPYDVEKIREDFPILAERPTASRSSIWTTPPRRRSRKPFSIGWSTLTSTNTPTSIGGCTISPTPRRRPTRPRARASAGS